MGINILLNQSITWTPSSGRNKYDEPTYGTAQTVKARFEEVTKIIKTAQGEDVGTDAEAFLPKSITPSEGDKIVYNSVTYRIIKVDRSWHRGSLHHWEAFLQKITS